MEREKVLGLISGIMDNYFTKATKRTESERVFGSPLIEKSILIGFLIVTRVD